MTESYYEILNISPQASTLEIEQAIDELRNDILNCPVSQEKITLIADTLLDQEKRSIYDRTLTADAVTTVSNIASWDESDRTNENSDNNTLPAKLSNENHLSTGSDVNFLSPFTISDNHSNRVEHPQEVRCPNCGATLPRDRPICSACGEKNKNFKPARNWYESFFIGHVQGTVISVTNEPAIRSIYLMRIILGVIVVSIISTPLIIYLVEYYKKNPELAKWIYIGGLCLIALGALVSYKLSMTVLKFIFGPIVNEIPVRTARLLDKDGQTHVLRINGEFLIGHLQEQDHVSLWGLNIAETIYVFTGKFIGENQRGIILLKK